MDEVMTTNEKLKNIELLVDGETAFPRIIERIRTATKTISINMFIWRDDKIGNQLAQELLQAADRGVKVRIVKDKLGELFEKAEETKQSFWHKDFNLGLWLKAAAVNTMYPMTGKAKSTKQRPNSLARRLLVHQNVSVKKDTIIGDHSKYYIFDDRVLILGGMNIEDKSIYADVEGKKYNDYMVELVSQSFVEKFFQRLRHGAGFDEQAPLEFIFNVRRKGEIVYEVKDKIIQLLASARESIDILMAYLGEPDITQTIIEAANRGVRINLLLPGKANLQHDLNMQVAKEILAKTDNRVKVFLSRNMIHAKLIRVDNRTVTIGSANLNKQAMGKLLELNVLIKNYSDDFGQALDQSIRRNLASATRISDGGKIKFNPIRARLEQLG